EAIFKNAAGTTTTDEVTLTVNPACVKPAISEQPLAQTVIAGETATFNAAGSTPTDCSAPTVQWYSEAPGAESFTAISEATSPTYTTPATTTTQSGTKFEAIFKNAAGTTTTDEVTLTVNPACVKPAISEQPLAQTVIAGETATFKAAGSTPTDC